MKKVNKLAIYPMKKCGVCERMFRPNSGSARYCGRKCRAVAAKLKLGSSNNNRKCDAQICERCYHATNPEDKCPWSRDLKPVDGWKAIKHKRKGIPGHTYRIIFCPLFKSDVD